MAHNFIYPIKDSWLYSRYPTYNYGLDEVLEIRKDSDVSSSTTTEGIKNSRILVQFDLSTFSSASRASASYFYLNMYSTNPSELAAEYTIMAYPVSQSWSNGTGFPAASKIYYNGVSWYHRLENTNWIGTGSSGAGGTYYTSSVSASQNFSYQGADIRMDVTNVVRTWIAGTLPNNGFILKFPDVNESDDDNYGRLTFYSRDTHTVTLPTLEAVWDDSVYITGSAQMIYSGNVYGTLNTGGIISGASFTGSYTGSSGNASGSITNMNVTVSSSAATITGVFTNVLSGTTFQPLTSEQLAIVMINLKNQYKYGTNGRIRFKGKDQFQRKTFLNTATTAFNIIKYLPMNNSWYSIVDAYSGRIIIPFSDYTKVSCDLNGNYFDLNFTGFMPERFYKIIFKITFNGSDTFIDNNNIFKVVK